MKDFFSKLMGNPVVSSAVTAIRQDPKRSLRVVGQLASLAKAIPHPVAQMVSRAGMAATAISTALPHKPATAFNMGLRQNLT